MPPVLDPSKSKVDGLAFVGLSLTRWSPHGHPDSQTHQTAFDFNDVLDREYIDVFSTNDDGWLVGGGEPGPPQSYKLAARDSGHVEIMRIGTYRPEWGGLDLQHLLKVLTQQHESRAGPILIPQIEVVPTAVVANPDTPPELEIRFDMEPEVIRDFDDLDEPLPLNWQLRFLHNQLFKTFVFPSRFCPGAFHSTILRKAEFRSVEVRRSSTTRRKWRVEEKRHKTAWWNAASLHQPTSLTFSHPVHSLLSSCTASNALLCQVQCGHCEVAYYGTTTIEYNSTWIGWNAAADDDDRKV